MNNASPLVSIGLVTRNRADIVGVAIDQLTGQTYKNIELIISDNYSDDATQTVCESYAKKDKRIRYIRQEKNIGMYNNFNFVLEQAKGALFLWATDDDEWEKNFIERMVALHLKHPTATIATSNYELFSENFTETTNYKYPEIASLPRSTNIYLYHAVFVTYGLVKTKALKKINGFFTYPWPIPDGIGDILVALRLLLTGDVAFDKDVLWRKRDSGYTFEKYNVLASLQLTDPILFRIRRYMVFPILYLYNLFFMSRDVLATSYSLSVKGILLYQIFGFYVMSNIEYICNVIKGIYSLFRGLIKHIFKIGSFKDA